MRNVRLLLATLALFIVSAPAFAQTLPSDAQTTCVASSQLFKSWFQSGSVSANGAVNPANSLNLNTSSNCNFYLWSQQMLLWLLSPAPAGYGGSGRVFDSNVFYDVSEPNSQGKRYFIPHISFPPDATQATKARRMVNLRPAKPGPNGLPAVLDRQGNIIEVLPADLGPNRRPLVLNQSGRSVEAARVSVSADNRAVFHDAAGNVIAQPKLNIPANLQKARVGQRFFTADNTPIIVGAGGVVFDVSPAQAGGAGVLLAQNSSVVYYTIVANDVFTYFASANASKTPPPLFPTTQAELDTIQKYASQTYGAPTFPDGIALAVEVKLSWVDISAVSNPSTYITSPAIVPTYDTSNPKLWVRTGEKFTTLALVGVHFVGSAAGHPEMIWSTFEHFGNSPTGQYQYVNKNNQTVTVPANSAGKWLFSASSSSGPFNVVHADYQKPPNIEGSTVNGQQFDVSPSDTQLVYSFGVAPMGQPNQNDPTPAAANTEVISINNSVLGQLASGDIRANYYFVGSTWTFGGYTPTGQYNPTTNNGNGSELGTNRLANSTMETYHQASSSINPPQGSGSNCFTCHTGSPVGQKATTVVSHIFSDMLPLGSFPATSPTDAPPPQVVPTLNRESSAKTSATTNTTSATSQPRTTMKKN
jgi:hypothetical protein